MASRKNTWRTGSPDRLNQLLENQRWDPVLMFGGQRPAQNPAPVAAHPPPAPPPPTAVKSSFVPPDWCAPPRGPTLAAHLLVWRGAALVETLPLGGKAFFVAGRLPSCDIVLEHASASREHAAILHHRSGAIYLIDLGSAHGTFLGSSRLPPREPTLWPEGTACIFGGSSRSHVLRVQSTAPLVPPHGVAPVSSSMPIYQQAPTLGAASGPGGPTVSTPTLAPRPQFAGVAPTTLAGNSTAEEDATSTGADGARPALDEEGWWDVDEECEANTQQNTCVPIEPVAEQLSSPDGLSGAQRSERRRQRQQADEQRQRLLERYEVRGGPRLLHHLSVRFDTQPPQVRYYTPPSPEAISDPEQHPSATMDRLAGSTPAMALPRPKCVVSFTTATGAKRPRLAEGGSDGAGSDGDGQFAHLVSHVDSGLSWSAGAGCGVDSSSGAAPSMTRNSNATSSSSGANGSDSSLARTTLSQRFTSLYDDDDAPPLPVSEGYDPGGGSERTSPHRAFPKERWFPSRTPSASSQRSHSSACNIQCGSQCTHTAAGRLVALGERLTVISSSDQPLIALVWQRPEHNPIADGPVTLRPSDSATIAKSDVAHIASSSATAPRRASSAAASTAGAPASPLLVSVVNLTARPILVYVALRESEGEGGTEGERALTPWEGSQAIEECPAPLRSESAVGRGANCLLLAPYEGTEQCEAEDAERAPFGESNTFRYVAATGVAVEALPPLITPLKLHVEASYQVTLASVEVGDKRACAGERGSGQVSLLADAYYDEDEAAPAEQVTAEEPFVVLTLSA